MCLKFCKYIVQVSLTVNATAILALDHMKAYDSRMRRRGSVSA